MAGQLTETQRNVDGKLSRRSTEQCQLILEIIQQADRHLDADEIYQQAQQKSPGISLSTVYRNLQLFKELGLILNRIASSREEVNRMPFGDGTGPRGMGPMTGRGAGYCAGFGRPGFTNPIPGRGWLGFGFGWGRPYGYPYIGRYGAPISYLGYGYPYYGRGNIPSYGYPYRYP